MAYVFAASAGISVEPGFDAGAMWQHHARALTRATAAVDGGS